MRLSAKLLEAMAAATVDTIRRALDGPLVHGRIAAVEARLAALERDHAVLSEKALKGGEPWQAGMSYQVGDCVQREGGLWRCIAAHVSDDSFSHACFRLQIKRGRAGKDAAR